MDVAEGVAEFVKLNTLAKSRALTDEEQRRWAKLKEVLIDVISRQPLPSPPPEVG